MIAFGSIINYVRLLALVLLLGSCLAVRSQNGDSDSLRGLLKKQLPDTQRVNLLNDLAKELRNVDPDTSLRLAREALALAVQQRFIKGMGKSCHNAGVACYFMGNYTEALKYFHFALPAWRHLYPPRGGAAAASTLGNMGLVYTDLGNYPQALECFLNVLQRGEDIGNRTIIQNSYANIGLVYFQQKDYSNALKYYSTGLKADEADTASPDKTQARSAKKGIAILKGNIGNIYYEKGELDTALQHYKESLRLREELNMKNLAANTLGNIAIIYSDKLKNKNLPARTRDSLIKLGHEYFSRALQVNEETASENGKAFTLINLGNLFLEENDLTEAEKHLQQGFELGQAIGAKDLLRSATLSLSRLDSLRGNFKASLENFRLYVQYRDSLSNEENTRKTVQTQMQYEFDKKEAGTRLEQEKKEVLAAAEKRRQAIILMSVSGLGLLILAFAIFAWRSLVTKKRANIEISRQKHIIEEKQKEILDSIHYAKRIQQSLLTSHQYINRNLQRLKKS